MNTRPHIRYCTRQEIDITRWDNCVEQAANRLIYGLHYYLDIMTGGQWDALVAEDVRGDYQMVMPLTWRRKWGITYLSQPAFTQQTGIFSRLPLTSDLIASFLKETATHFSFAEIFLNYANPGPGLDTRTNLVLSLDKPYHQLAAGYSENLRRNLRRAGSHSLIYTADIRRTEALEAYRQLYQHRNRKTKSRDYRNFETLCQHRQSADGLILRAVTDQHRQPLAIAVVLTDANRLYLLQSTTLPQGRNKASTHFLIDQLIREFAGQPLLLDFEGSDDPGVARFYAGFGSIDQPYYFCRFNHLPWPARLFKTSTSAIPPRGLDRQA